MSLLAIQRLNAGYNGTQVLRDVSLSIESGEFVALIGPNGAGKSTVLKSIFGLTNIRGGTIEIEGHSSVKQQTHTLLELGVSYVPQGRIVFPSLSVKENLRLGGYLLNNKSVLAQRIEEVFDQFPALRAKQRSKAGDLSGGVQQQLAIGRALVVTPKLLLLDEPSLGLSPKLQIELFEKLTKLRDQGLTILCVEQNVRLVLRFADRGYLLVNGEVRLAGSSQELGRPEVMEQAYLR